MNTISRPNTNPLVTALLTDMYQLSMAYGYWVNNFHNKPASFDLFFRTNPFKGEYTVFAGIEEVVKFVRDWKFSNADLDYIYTYFPNPAFIDYLRGLNSSSITLHAMTEGTICFPREPLIRIEGPLALCQLMETTLLCLVNFPTLITTNATRFALSVSPEATLMEFGLRRAQGPDGALSASRYAMMGGFTATSNVMSALLCGGKAVGTMAHSFIQSFNPNVKLNCTVIERKAEKDVPDGKEKVDLYAETMKARTLLEYSRTNEGELISFIAYAYAFPDSFLALIDTYDTIESGLRNFLCVAIALDKAGYRAKGIRLDSGDLAILSKQCRAEFVRVGKLISREYFGKFTIVASNDINENALASLNESKHEIDTFGIGTHLVTCQSQPALGGVFKLVELCGEPRIKFSQDIIKITIPCAKTVYRLYKKSETVEQPFCDVMTLANTTVIPKADEPFALFFPFENEKIIETPTRVECLHHTILEKGVVKDPSLFPPLDFIRSKVLANTQGGKFDPKIIALRPTAKYPIYLSEELNEACIKVCKNERVDKI